MEIYPLFGLSEASLCLRSIVATLWTIVHRQIKRVAMGVTPHLDEVSKGPFPNLVCLYALMKHRLLSCHEMPKLRDPESISLSVLP